MMDSTTDTNPKLISYQSLLKPFLAGACAGLAVDLTLFPLDTIKTRLQSSQGFIKSGGFSRLYLGIGSTFSGSAPGAALFFLAYESTKHLLSGNLEKKCTGNVRENIIAAGFAESVACLVRVPVEVVKQRAQAYHLNSVVVFRQTITEFGYLGLYRGYLSTIYREIPFAAIQFPLWERLKQLCSNRQESPIRPYQSMLSGSIAGGVSAFLTTPLDVAKTRIMLQDFHGDHHKQPISSTPTNYCRTIISVYQEKGIRGLFAGAGPRVLWISIGGAIFLGGYDFVSVILS